MARTHRAAEAENIAMEYRLLDKTHSFYYSAWQVSQVLCYLINLIEFPKMFS